MKVQRLNIELKDEFQVARKYYQIISVLNDLKLSEGQLQLVAFTAIRGNISDPGYRKEYCDTYKTTSATINNVVDKMKKKGVMVKHNKMIFVNKVLTEVDFNESLALVVTMTQTIKPTVTKKVKKKDELNIADNE